MDVEHIANLGSAIIGMSGTALLFFNSREKRQTLGASDKNRKSVARQKIGLGLLCASFLIQAVVALSPNFSKPLTSVSRSLQ